MSLSREMWARLVLIAGVAVIVALIPMVAQAQECEGDECGDDGTGSDEDGGWPSDPCGPIDPDQPCYGSGGSSTSTCYQSACMDCRTWQYSPVVPVCRRVAYNKRCSCTDNPCTLRGGSCYYTIPT